MDDEARAENIALLEELRSRVQKAETASEEYQKQLNLMQARLEESQQAHGQLEDQLHEKNLREEELETEKAQAARQKREVETIYESERTALLKEKAEQTVREEEMKGTIQRLKESLAQREIKTTDSNKELPQSREFSTLDLSSFNADPTLTATGGFAPPASMQRTNSGDQAKLMMQKDRVIESMRLELAEAQIKIMELDSAGGGQMHELERKLMETKIENARLTEDNESFQLLLSEKTLNGEFSKTDAMQSSTGLGSLAEELGSEDLESNEDKPEGTRKLELEIKSLKDQNKALAVYIENIIGRLLQHKDFDTIFDKNPDLMSGAPRPQNASAANTDKDLPPPPPPKDNPKETEGGGFLQRATSVLSKRPRPTSQVQPIPAPTPTSTASGPNADPIKAPSIPLGRSASRAGHKRAVSEIPNPNAAPLVNQLYRGPPSFGAAGASLASPGLSPSSTSTRNPFFTPAATSSLTTSANTTTRAPSGAGSRSSTHEKQQPGSSSNSTFSDHSGGGGVDSPPRNSAGAAGNNFTGAVMTQSRLRPLRLVQESGNSSNKGAEDAAALAARKKANRGSWMPAWMAQRAPSGEQ